MRLQYLSTKAARAGYRELRFLCWEINRKFRKSVTVSTKQGIFTVLFGADEAVGKYLYSEGNYELDLMLNAMEFFRKIGQCPSKGKGTIVDVGANIGVTAIGMLHTGELERAIAIEPEPRNFSLLQRNVILNGLEDKVICLPYAASDREGEIPFELSDTNFGDHRVRTNSRFVDSDSFELFNESARRVISIEAAQLDSMIAKLPELFTKNIVLFWIDVQGYEGYVFLGAERELAKGIPVVSEIWPYGIKRAGMTQEQFCNITKSIWTHYWVWRTEKFVRYPIDTLDIFFDELGDDGGFENIIFTQ